jgi:hypothetical protein
MVFSLRRTALYAGIALTTVLTGCSSSGGNLTSSSAPATTTSPATSSAPASSSPANNAPPTGGAPADAATKTAVTHAFSVFFDTKTSLTASMAVLQHGEKFRQALIAQGKNPAAKGINAKVTAVQLPSAHVAYVTYNLMSGSSPLLSGTHGYAVKDGGKWKVAAATFCGLLQLQNTAPPACNDPTIIALPN